MHQVVQAALLEAPLQRLVADQVGDGPAETQHEERGEKRRAAIGQGTQADGRVLAQAGDQPRVVGRLAEGGQAADQPERAEGLAPQDIQRPLAMRPAEQRQADHAERGKQRAADQHVGHDHGQGLAQGTGQHQREVEGNEEGDQPGPQLAYGEQHQVAGLGVVRQFRRQAEAFAHASPQPEQRRGETGPEQEDHGEIEDDGRQLAPGRHALFQFGMGQLELLAP
ncbi:hypothetical protein D9M68_706530 [compost metagenome]